MTEQNEDALRGVRSGFPQSPSDFDHDPRISFSKLEEKYLLETDEGNEYEWDNALRRWVTALDESLLEQQGQVYKVAGVDETATAPQDNKEKKRKVGKNGDDSNKPPKKPRVNTAVYVTNIPLSADADEINHVFKTCGVIAEEIDSGKPRIKMYEDESGNFKGDALIVYFRPESVKLAIQMLDDSDFRLGEAVEGKMKVTEASYEYKKQQDAPVKKAKGDQKKIIKRTQKLNSKLADWDDDDPSTVQDTTSKFDKVVILKHMFTLAEIEEDPAAILDIKEDIREECAKLGDVTNVVLFDKEPAGVASVRFSNATAAEACVRLMNGRWFDERQLEAHISTGKEKFRRNDDKKAAVNFDDSESEEDEERAHKFGQFLEQGSDRCVP